MNQFKSLFILAERAEQAEAKLRTEKLIEMRQIDNLQARLNALLMNMSRQQQPKQPIRTEKLIESTQMKYDLAMHTQLIRQIDNLQARLNALLMDMCRQQQPKQPKQPKQPAFPKFRPVQLPKHRLGGPTRLRPASKIPPLRLIGKRNK